MKYALIGVGAFLIVVYAYTFIRHRRKKNNQIDTVKEFRKRYLEKSLQEKRDLPQGYTRYQSKYNSSVDFVEKSEFLKEGSDPPGKRKRGQDR